MAHYNTIDPISPPEMIKALQWISAGLVFLAIWISGLLTPIPNSPILNIFVLYLPLFVILLVGLASLTYILYSVMTFNDCPEEAKKLKLQIDEARKGLKAAGYKF